MVKLHSDSWFSGLMRTKGSKKNTNNSNTKKKSKFTSAAIDAETKSSKIGVVAFELARLMSRAVNLWHSLSDSNISRLKNHTIRLDGIRKLVGDDDEFLLGLAVAETTASLGSLARSIALLAGQRCSDPVLRRFDLVFADLVNGGSDPYGLEFAGRKMDRKIKKMERLVAATSNLYQELEVLAELEQTLRRMRTQQSSKADFKHKVLWQRQEVKRLRDSSLWIRSYDYAVRLLARSLFTTVGRMNQVFGGPPGAAADTDADILCRSYSFAGMSISPPDRRRLTRFSSANPLTVSPPVSDGGLGSTLLRSWKHHSWRKSRLSVSSRSFSGCIVGGIEPPVTHSCMNLNAAADGRKHLELEVQLRGNIFEDVNLSQILFGPRRSLLNAPLCTLGAAALALHYANIIILIEKFTASSHLIGPDARDDLYNMLTTNIRAALRARLKSYAKNLSSSVYDPILAAEWSDALTRILDWLSPLAHNMIRWHSDRTFDQQHLVSSANVLLLQTLYFANQAKTEAAITELLVGLNYLWRFGKELNGNAILECVSSRNFADCLDSKS